MAAACLAGCQQERWQVDEKIRAPDAEIATALGDTAHQNPQEISAEDVPEIAYPRALRPCCAFGADLKVKAGAVPCRASKSVRLVRVLDDWCVPFPSCHLFYPSRRQPSPAFALLVDALRFRGRASRATPASGADRVSTGKIDG